MLKLTLTLGGNLLDLDGEVTVPDVLPVITSWLAAVPQSLDLDHLQEMTARLTKSTQALSDAVRVTAAESPRPSL